MSLIWDRCESLVALERYWSTDRVNASLSIDTSVKSPMGTGSIKMTHPAVAGVWDLYVVERFNPDASLLKDFTISRPYSVFVRGSREVEWRIEVVTREPPEAGLGWNMHEVARQMVPANVMTEIVFDYSGISDAALQMAAQVSVITFIAQQAFTGYIAGITEATIATYGILSVDTAPIKGEVFVDGISWGTAPQNRVVEAGSHVVMYGNVLGYFTPEGVTVGVVANQVTSVLGTYSPAYSISIDSTPISVEFSIILGGMETSYTTPWSATLAPNVYRIAMPTQVRLGGRAYTFGQWNDGDPNPVKDVEIRLDTVINLMATFVPTTPTLPNIAPLIVGIGTIVASQVL